MEESSTRGRGAEGLQWAIRAPRRGDIPEIVRMRRALWPDSDPGEVPELLAPSCPRSYTLRVAERAAGGLAGFLEMATREFADGCGPGPVAYLEGIWVDPDARRSGLGAALVEELLTWATSRGLREVASDTGPDNLASQAFHEALGFQEAGRAVLYRLRLPGP